MTLRKRSQGHQSHQESSHRVSECWSQMFSRIVVARGLNTRHSGPRAKFDAVKGFCDQVSLNSLAASERSSPSSAVREFSHFCSFLFIAWGVERSVGEQRDQAEWREVDWMDLFQKSFYYLGTKFLLFYCKSSFSSCGWSLEKLLKNKPNFQKRFKHASSAGQPNLIWDLSGWGEKLNILDHRC